MSEPLAQLSLQEFANRLASKEPIPGGGAVAAVTAAHAAALGCMVLAYTLGKPKFAAHEIENKKALECLQRAQNEAHALADQDAIAYGTLSALWKLPPPMRVEWRRNPPPFAPPLRPPWPLLFWRAPFWNHCKTCQIQAIQT
jgi:formiminotetrahydrofolate cyclodeaminase